MKCFIATIFSLLIGLLAASSQTPKEQLKPTEQVVTEYLRLVANGTLLKSDGWKKTGKLFDVWNASPPDQTIHLMGMGILGEQWGKDGRAYVETKWADDMGSIDPMLRYSPRAGPPVSMTGYGFYLVFTNQHREIGTDGKTQTEVIGPSEWKIEGPMTWRTATVETALAYVSKRRDKTSDLKVRRNAEKTIKTLQGLHRGCGGGNASAC
jgi:hypothetical protein